MADPLPERVQTLFDIFTKAINSERAAQAMYQKAIDHCDDPEMIKVFDRFRVIEIQHEQELIELYGEMRKKYNVGG